MNGIHEVTGSIPVWSTNSCINLTLTTRTAAVLLVPHWSQRCCATP